MYLFLSVILVWECAYKLCHYQLCSGHFMHVEICNNHLQYCPAKNDSGLKKRHMCCSDKSFHLN